MLADIIEKILGCHSGMSGIPMRRLDEPEELVGPVLCLASDVSVFVTGGRTPANSGDRALSAGGPPEWY